MWGNPHVKKKCGDIPSNNWTSFQELCINRGGKSEKERRLMPCRKPPTPRSKSQSM